MNWRKLTVAILLYAFIIWFMWLWANFEPEGDVWMSFFKKLPIVIIAACGTFYRFFIWKNKSKTG